MGTSAIDELPQLIRKVENAFSLAKNYFDENGLLINAKKTQIIFIGNRQLLARIPPDTTINYDNHIITPIKHAKNLGVHFDCFMSFDVHIDELSRKVMGLLIYLNRIKDKFDKTTRITVIESLVLSLINYCCKIWGSANKTLLLKVQKLLNFAARVADGTVRKYDHITPVLKELQWMKIEKIYVFHVCVFVYKALHGELPSWLYTFPSVMEINASRTRQANNLFVPRTNTDTGKRAMVVRGPTIWNELPLDIREMGGSLNTFKHALKKYFLAS